VIRLDSISKQFSGRPALEDLTLEVKRGDIYGLLGHNGAGKSTAIGIMLGQVWPGGGRVSIRGYDVSSHRRKALERVGAIFESPAFYDYLSGYRNLEILSSYTAPTPRTRLMEVIEWVGLTGRAESKVRTYSHGMRARLALAQALLPGPELLILDEPSDGLDPEGIHEMRRTILRLRQELDMTILLSSHFLHEVEQLCTRIAVLNQGRKVFEGALEQVKKNGSWYRVRVGDFVTACKNLRSVGLILDSRGANGILLSPGRTIDEVVRNVVQLGIPVYEVVQEAQTLESFYLDLMRAERAPVAH
jgi:ABC-2 type transport system ATP-binding protein